MNTGRLRNKVIIARRSTARSDYGEIEKQLTEVSQVWADIDDNKAVNEAFTSDNIQYQSIYKVTIRYNTDVKNGDYMIIDNLAHRITNLYQDRKRRKFTKFDALLVEGIE